MKLVLLKDWAGNKKGATVTVTDKAVQTKGLSEGLFEKPKEKETKIDNNQKDKK